MFGADFFAGETFSESTRSTLSAQIELPISDVATGSWSPSTVAAPLYQMIDETIPSDADYIYATAV